MISNNFHLNPTRLLNAENVQWDELGKKNFKTLIVFNKITNPNKLIIIKEINCEMLCLKKTKEWKVS